MRRLAVAVLRRSPCRCSPSPPLPRVRIRPCKVMCSTSREARCPASSVVVTHQGSGMFRQVVSNADGSYFVTGILPGPYAITADLTGFKKCERPDVLLQIGNTATLDITLGVGGLEESVTVSGELAAGRHHLEADRRQHRARPRSPRCRS